MKFVASAAVAIFILVFALVPTGNAANLEPLGKLSVSGGVEREPGDNDAGGRGTAELLGTFPLADPFGIEGGAFFKFGLGSRFGVSAGPVLSFAGGKAGIFAAYEHRGLRGTNFVWARPSIALYDLIPQTNLNVWASQPLTTVQHKDGRREIGSNQIQGTVSYFVPWDIMAPFMARDNVELTLGIQVNNFAGPAKESFGVGVGPVFGVSIMPVRNLTVNLVRASFDSQSRYSVNSGVEYAFWSTRMINSLKDLRRMYLEPNPDLPGLVGEIDCEQGGKSHGGKKKEGKGGGGACD